MKGEHELMNIRVKAEELTHKLGIHKEFEKLNVFFTQLLGPKKFENMKSSQAENGTKRKFKRRFRP